MRKKEPFTDLMMESSFVQKVCAAAWAEGWAEGVAEAKIKVSGTYKLIPC
jgi:hypothetical protein